MTIVTCDRCHKDITNDKQKYQGGNIMIGEYVIEKDTGDVYEIMSIFIDIHTKDYHLKKVYDIGNRYVSEMYLKQYFSPLISIVPSIDGLPHCSKTIWDDISKIITNGPATIVIWNDGTKTVVKRSESERTDYDLEKGLAMAVLKKKCGDKYYNRMKKVIKDKWEDHDNK